jgi:hypothetical protein
MGIDEKCKPVPHLCRRWNALIQQHSNVVAGEAGIEQQ